MAPLVGRRVCSLPLTRAPNGRSLNRHSPTDHLRIPDPWHSAPNVRACAADLGPYQRAFEQIRQDPRNFLIVVRDADGVVTATMQLTLIPGLSRGGASRLQIEAVRVADRHRGIGLGTSLFTWAHDHGRRHGARLAQLTTDKARPEAHRFYASLGYQTSHEGMKLDLSS